LNKGEETMADNQPNVVEREDPLLTFMYQLDVQDTITGFFTECSGIGSEHDVAEQQAVDANGHAFVMKVPGRLKYTDVTLKRGITSSMDIWEWRAVAEAGDMASCRKNATITAFNRNFEAVAQWNFYNAWPMKVSGPDFNSSNSEFGVEEVVIVHEGFHRVK
jgi:phage tail-like protein